MCVPFLFLFCSHCKLPCLMCSSLGVEAEQRLYRLRVVRVFGRQGATFNRTADGHPGFLPTGPTGGLFGNYYWPTTERSIANVGAAFPEAIIRTIFGFQPGWRQPPPRREIDRAEAVQAQLVSADIARPFRGVLANLRTSYGLMNLSASVAGVRATASAST